MNDIFLGTPDGRNFVSRRRLLSGIAVLAAGRATSLLASLHSETGAITGTGEAKLRETVSVTDFMGILSTSGAFQAAIAGVADGGTIVIPPGSYVFTAEVSVTARNNITFVSDNALISGNATRFRSYFYLSNSSNIIFDGIRFDQMQPSLPTYTSGDYDDTYNVPIYANICNGIEVRNCRFSNLYTSSVYCYQSSNVLVDKCLFTSPVQTQNQWLQFIHLQTYGGMISITRNRFENATTTNPARNPCAVFASGGAASSALKIIDNFSNFCGRDNAGAHRLAVYDIYGDAQNVIIEDNISVNTMSQFSRLSATRGGKVHNNRITMSVNAELDYSIVTVESTIWFSPGQVGAQSISITKNIFDDPASRAAFAVGVLSYDWGAPALNISVVDNEYTGARRKVVVQGPFQNVYVQKNSGAGAIEIGHNGVNAANVTAKLGTEADSKFGPLFCDDNVTVNESGTDRNGINVSLNKVPRYSGTVDLLHVHDNVIEKIGARDKGQAIAVIVNASVLQGRLSLRGNKTSNFTYDWYVRSTKEVVIEDNRPLNTATARLLEDGTNGTIRRMGNRASSGSVQ